MRWWWWLLLGGAAAAVFMGTGLGGPLDSVAGGVLLVLLPGVGLAQRAIPAEELRANRLGAYASSILGLGLIALLALWAWPEAWVSPEGWFAWRGSAVGLAGVAALLTAGGLAISYAFRELGARFGWEETEVAHAVMPATRGEKGLFAFLSLVAGACEEIAFRGFVPLFILPWFGHYMLAALPASLVFGILHAYQGAHGMVRTGLMGLLLAAGVAWTGSLLPSMLAHAALDLLIGLVLGDSLLGRGTERGNEWT